MSAKTATSKFVGAGDDDDLLDDDDDDDSDDDDDDDDYTTEMGSSSAKSSAAASGSGSRAPSSRPTSRNSAGKKAAAAAAASSSTNANEPDRLQKNREIARNCRKRKRERSIALREEVKRLRDWNRQLETKLNRDQNNQQKELVRQREVSEIEQMVRENRSDDEIRTKLADYKEVYSDFGRNRRAAIEYHLQELQTLLLPNQVSKMTLWSLQQDDDFYDEQKNESTFGGGIWNMLCKECQLSDEQKKELLAMRAEIRTQRDNVSECLRILKELETRIKNNISSMHTQMSRIMKATTPMQQAKFLLWIEKNQAAVICLNNVWNRKHMFQS